MTNDEQPQPVMIPVRPRFDKDGKPTCRGCPLEVDEWTDISGHYYRCSEDWDSYVRQHSRMPDSTCPIHNPQAREGMEPL